MCACTEILCASLSSSSPVLPYGVGPAKQSGISFELRVRRGTRRVKKLPKLEDDGCSNNEISVCVCETWGSVSQKEDLYYVGLDAFP